MKIAICDDEISVLNEIKSLLAEYCKDYDRDSTRCKDFGGEILAGSTDNDPSEGGHCTEGDDRRTGQCGCPFPK